jgi:hypothetical protein
LVVVIWVLIIQWIIACVSLVVKLINHFFVFFRKELVVIGLTLWLEILNGCIAEPLVESVYFWAWCCSCLLLNSLLI